MTGPAQRAMTFIYIHWPLIAVGLAVWTLLAVSFGLTMQRRYETVRINEGMIVVADTIDGDIRLCLPTVEGNADLQAKVFQSVDPPRQPFASFACTPWQRIH